MTVRPVSAGVIPQSHESITPSDTVDAKYPYVAVWVGTGGDVSAVDLAGNTAVYKNVPSGSTLVGYFARINATGTTATDLVGRW